MAYGRALEKVGAAWRSFRRSVRGVASLPEHLRVLREGLADSREIEQSFHDAVLAHLAQLQAATGAAGGEWLAEWDAVARAPIPARRRLEALRVIFARLLAARSAPAPAAASPAAVPKTLTIEIAPGEVLDRMTILEIKLARMTDEAKLRNVRHEHALLAEVESRLPRDATLAALRADLHGVNEALWDIEDHIRDLERAQDFGPRFVEVARSVYRTNDRRAALKRRINEHLGSLIVEEKSYAPY